MKKIIPIAFCFDDNVLIAAGVCLTSLLEHAKTNTFYDVFILHDAEARFPDTGYLERLRERYQNFKITYRRVGTIFQAAYEIRGITKAAYYRLLIPEIITEYDKIMYHDIDVIFRDDLSEIFTCTNMLDEYVAGVALPYSEYEDYITGFIGVEANKYILSGNIIINSRKIMEDGLISDFIEEAKKEWKYQDMDIINLVCKNKIKYLPPSFSIVSRTSSEILKDPNQNYYSKDEVDYAIKYGTIHYNGNKPWNTWCLNFDIWWEYYRKSPYFDLEFYYSFYCNKLDEYDYLPLLKRIKILLRYFKTKG
ncbi:glycosyltransferase family 8 protein [Elizabethkingia meningoseptica]|uniref:glycosyltransferase family 8 protein n=1 Tax=Elizabethkingia meningoseptica TaxID=238 RepID=UPI0023B07A3B|nr:glycosyltransferase [Elizabethkingia meningoseptica]MDE5483493.1 glycosyltransferase family 8 protein [Elizabethkingia meningoseptica]